MMVLVLIGGPALLLLYGSAVWQVAFHSPFAKAMRAIDRMDTDFQQKMVIKGAVAKTGIIPPDLVWAMGEDADSPPDRFTRVREARGAYTPAGVPRKRREPRFARTS